MMAAYSKARLNPKQDERCREAIRTTQIIKRLNTFVFEENCPQSGKKLEIDTLRMKAIEILLRKSLPDLSAVQVDATHDISDPMKELFDHVAAKGARLGGS
jgi:hypothetical protein